MLDKLEYIESEFGCFFWENGICMFPSENYKIKCQGADMCEGCYADFINTNGMGDKKPQQECILNHNEMVSKNKLKVGEKK